MKQRSSVLLFTAALALIVTGCGKQEATSGGDTVKIGMASPLTGPQSHIGQDIKNGTLLGVEEINAQGLEIGGKKLKLELLAEDDEANPAKATTVAQKLVDSKVVAVVGHFNSGSSIPASKVYADAGIPQISPGSTNPRYTQQGYATTFRVVANDDQQGPAGALGHGRLNTALAAAPPLPPVRPEPVVGVLDTLACPPPAVLPAQAGIQPDFSVLAIK